MNKQEALAMLRQCDHAMLFEKEATEIAEPFGVKPYMSTFTVNPDAFKGLSVPGYKKGDKVKGIDAADLGDAIAAHLTAGYRNHCMGRGFRLSVACDAIKKALDTAG